MSSQCPCEGETRFVFCDDNPNAGDAGIAFNVYVCKHCGAILRVDVWDNAVVLRVDFDGGVYRTLNGKPEVKLTDNTPRAATEEPECPEGQDGVRVLGWDGKCWSSWWWYPGFEDEPGRWVDPQAMTGSPTEPTHWVPIPPAPTEE